MGILWIDPTVSVSIVHTENTYDLGIHAFGTLAHFRYTYSMMISDRDLKIVTLVARFRQVSAKQIASLEFPLNASRAPVDRALARLVRDQLLERIERRTVGGARGGSGQYVYTLGRKGYYRHFTGRFSVPRTVDYHALAIVDTYVGLREAERVGEFQIQAFSTEPDCWRVVAGVELRPDLFVVLHKGAETVQMWIEVDMATEGQRQLKGKLEAYYRAYLDADLVDMPEFPRVIWLAIDVERKRELEYLVSTMPREAQALFMVATQAEFSP